MPKKEENLPSDNSLIRKQKFSRQSNFIRETDAPENIKEEDLYTLMGKVRL